jgi:hypothetical protein
MTSEDRWTGESKSSSNDNIDVFAGATPGKVEQTDSLIETNYVIEHFALLSQANRSVRLAFVQKNGYCEGLKHSNGLVRSHAETL